MHFAEEEMYLSIWLTPVATSAHFLERLSPGLIFRPKSLVMHAMKQFYLNDSFLLEFGSWCKEQIFVLSESWRENREL